MVGVRESPCDETPQAALDLPQDRFALQAVRDLAVLVQALELRRHIAGDQIDFATGHASPAGEDPPAVQPQPPGGDALGAAAALLGDGAAVQRASSSARA